MQQLTIATVAFVGLIVDSIVKSIFLDFELDAVQSLHLYNFFVGSYLHDIDDTENEITKRSRVVCVGEKCKNHVKKSQQRKTRSTSQYWRVMSFQTLRKAVRGNSKKILFFSLKRQTITFHFSFQQNMTSCEIMIDIIRSLFSAVCCAGILRSRASCCCLTLCDLLAKLQA